MRNKKILIVYHSQGGNTEAAARAVADGVRTIEGIEPVLKRASKAGVEDLTDCDAVCFGTPDYFSYMAGMLKDFFDRTFYPTQGQLDNKPCGIFVTHGGGGKASKSVEKICQSFKLRQIAPAVVVKNKPDETARIALRKLGATLAETLH